MLARLATFIEDAPVESLVIAIEDLHWADVETRELFYLLAGRLRSKRDVARRVRLVGTARAAPGHDEILERAREVADAQILEIAPLDAAGSAVLIRGAFSGAEIPERVLATGLQLSAGSPLM